MDALVVMLKNVIVFVLLAVPGLLLVKTKLMGAEQSGVLSKLLLYIAMPFLIVSSTLGLSFNGELLKTSLISAVIGIGYTFLWLLFTKWLTAKETEEKKRGMMRFCILFTNNGFLGIPLATAVFLDKPLVITCVIIINIISNALMYTVGVYLISGDKSTVSAKKALANPILIAFVIGLLLNVCKVKEFLPEVSTYTGYLGNMVTPLSMIILGMKLGGVKFSSLFTKWETYYVSAFKLIVMPLLIVGITLLLDLWLGTGEELVLGVFVAFGLPTAALSTTFADHTGGDTENAVVYTLGSTVLSVATIPLLYGLISLFL